MKKSRFNEEQILAMIKEQGCGATTAEVCRKHGISTAYVLQVQIEVRRAGRKPIKLESRIC